MAQASTDQHYRNIEICSRYDLDSEIAAMKSVVDALPLISRLHIHSIYCDSKACACYSVELCSGSDLDDMEFTIEIAFKRAVGGYNGIFLNSKEGNRVIDPHWPGDDQD